MKYKNRIASRIILAAHGISNRSQALVYINGEVFLDSEHPFCVFQYLLKNNKLDNFLYEFYKDKKSKEEIDNIINEVKTERKCFPEDIFDILCEYNNWDTSIINLPIAFGHYVKNFKGEEAIYLILNSINNVSIDTVIQAIINKYPNIPIFDDHESHYNLLYSPTDNKKFEHGKSLQCKIVFTYPPKDNINENSAEQINQLLEVIIPYLLETDKNILSEELDYIDCFISYGLVTLQINFQYEKIKKDVSKLQQIKIFLRRFFTQMNTLFKNPKRLKNLTFPWKLEDDITQLSNLKFNITTLKLETGFDAYL